MNIFRDLKSIRAGEAKAKRDLALIIEHKKRHHELHESDADWSCKQFGRDFYDSLGSDVDAGDRLEKAAYSRISDAYNERMDEQDFAEAAMQTIPMELSKQEYEAGPDQAFLDRVKAAIEDDIAFREMVINADKDKKEGK